jgi:CRP-like cAMP-binding protein
MQGILDFCAGADRRRLTAGEMLIREDERTGRLYVLINGQVEVVKGDTVVASVTDAGAIFGEMSILLGLDHSASVRAVTPSEVYVIVDATTFLRDKPELVLLIARLLARRLSAATSYLADLKRQYAHQGNHLAMVGDVLQSMINLPPADVTPGSDLQSDPRI